ncbi:hypothetical protein [Streptacidiphilus carbonis]|jgi:hypothetical protein|uniref:hypothetical protein n=1 Tax=Streptacidiphilus carbonis TaxID=105422 RepID=UPI0005A889C8|nr:hypothetical protein [Streptacidiphilus carbonis]
MQRSKRLAIVAAALAASTLGAAGSATAAPASSKVTSSAAVAPTVVEYTAADVAALNTKLPKGWHATLAPARARVSPDIYSEPCTGGWGVEVWNSAGNCTAFGYTGTTGWIGWYVTYISTYNNYGWIQTSDGRANFGTCTYFKYNPLKLLEYLHIDGFTNSVMCANSIAITAS